MSEPTVTRTVWDVRPGDSLHLVGEGAVTVELVDKSGRLARLKVTAPRDVKISKAGAPRVGTSMAT